MGGVSVMGIDLIAESSDSEKEETTGSLRCQLAGESGRPVSLTTVKVSNVPQSGPGITRFETFVGVPSSVIHHSPF